MAADQEQGLLSDEMKFERDFNNEPRLWQKGYNLARIHRHYSSRNGLLFITASAVLAILSIVTLFNNKTLTSHMEDVYNSTLGFQKIYAINMPERTDHRDALSMAASLTDMEIEWMQAVKGQDIAKSAAPHTWDFKKHTDGELGCWRAHMNTLQKMVEDRVTSALIIEDDSDWDMSIKDQFLEFAHGSRAIQHSLSRGSSPYGSDWDFLWLGHCRIAPNNDAKELYIIENDLTVPPMSHRYSRYYTQKVPEQLIDSNTTRIVFDAYWGHCTFGYAVSFNGARRILNELSIKPTNDALDVAYRKLCNHSDGGNLRCIGVYPPLISTHRPAGRLDQDSDIQKVGSKWHDEYTWDITYSTVLNAGRVLAGKTTILSQWPNDTASDSREIALNTHRPVRGRLMQVDLGFRNDTPIKYLNG